MTFDVIAQIRIGPDEVEWTVTALDPRNGRKIVDTGRAPNLATAVAALVGVWVSLPRPPSGWRIDRGLLVWAGRIELG